MNTETKQGQLEVKKIYIKDVSFESPVSPQVFGQTTAEPQIDVQLRVSHQALNEEKTFNEVFITSTVTANIEEKAAMLIEVQQAGIFQVSGFDEQHREAVLEVACPNILLPFLRETISDLVTKGGFPQLLINPINFEVLYREKMRKRAEQDSAKASGKANGESADGPEIAQP